MNYANLKSELDFIRNDAESNLTSILELKCYYQIIHTNLISQHTLFQNQINQAIQTQSTNPNLPSNIIALFTNFHQMSSKLNALINRFSHVIITPLDSFLKSESLIYNDSIKKFQALIEDVLNANRTLDNSKLIYYNSAYIASFKGNEGNERIALTKKVNEKLYDYEYEYYTIRIKECNENYKKMTMILKQNEESRIYFMKYTIDEYCKLIEEYKALIEKMILVINELFSSKVCELELLGINNKIDSFSKNLKERIPLENYVSFEQFIIDKDNKKEINQNTFNFEIISSSLNDEDEKSYELISKAKTQLCSNEEININLLMQIIRFIRNNPNNTANLFLESFNNNEWYRFSNENNLYHLLTICLFISNNTNGLNNNNNETHDEKNKSTSTSPGANHNNNNSITIIEKYHLNKKLITITKKIYYQNNTIIPIQKIYLSALISQKDSMFHMKTFWKELFTISLSEILNNHLNHNNNNSIQINDTTITTISTNTITNISNEIFDSKIAKTRNFISSTSSSIFSRFWGTNDTNSKHHSIFIKSNINNFIHNYTKLSISDLNALESLILNEIKQGTFFKDYINNLSYFNYPIEKSIELLTEIGEDLRIDKDLLNYFISYTNISWYTIKRIIPNDTSSNNQNYYYMHNYRLTAKERRIKLITFALDYLNWKDYYHLLQLNKEAFRKLANKIFKKALEHPSLTMTIRFKIWDSILKIEQLRKSYNYTVLKENTIKSLDQKTIKCIEDDIPRTFIAYSLRNDLAITNIAIRNILQVISQVTTDGKYCQGMNFIAHFLYEITGDEEKAFNIFLGIFKSTEYSLIFGQDLLKFKVFFYVFERLLSVYAPEISKFFTINKVEVYFFLAPCFYTLFQNVRENIKDSNDIPMILLRIFDGCFTSGWKYLMKVGLNLLEENEEKILEMNYGDLIEFLTRTVFCSDFFDNSQRKKFEKVQKRKIPKKLIEYIEQEYIQDIAMKELEKEKMKDKDKDKDKDKERKTI